MNFLIQQNAARIRHYVELFVDEIKHRASLAPRTYDGRILVNSFPKAGTHLLESILRKFPGLHCPMHRTLRIAADDHCRKLCALRSGTFRTGHLPYTKELETLINKTGIHHLFLIRNPPNVIVSQIRYLTEQHRTNPYSKYFLACTSRTQQIQLVIKGNEAFKGLGERLQAYRPWLDNGPVRILRFEELMQALHTADRNYFQQLLDFIGMSIDDEVLAQALDRARAQPGLTFSGSVSNDWGEHYNSETLSLYEDHVLEQAVAFGYREMPRGSRKENLSSNSP